uniref:Uncharacterized protein n=1 Tax=Arundo donax TaxID=35708 RepID=A0A0A9FJR4_ARUDO
MPQLHGQGWQWLTGHNMKLQLLMMLNISILMMQMTELFIHLNRQFKRTQMTLFNGINLACIIFA